MRSAGFPLPINLPVNQGYLSVDNTTIQYRETGMQGPDRVIVADLADANNIQGYMQTILRIVTGGGQAVLMELGIRFRLMKEQIGIVKNFKVLMPIHKEYQVLGQKAQP